MLELLMIIPATLSLILYGVMLNNYLSFDLNSKISPKSLPISLLVPFKNEIHNLPQLINCIANQDYDLSHVEIIFIDDHSEDFGDKIIVEGLKQFPNAQLISNSGIGKKQALLTGINHASNSWILSTDADTSPCLTWISTMVGYIQPNYTFIAGPIELVKNRTLLSPILQIEHYALQQLTKLSIARKQPLMANGANMLFKKDIGIAAFSDTTIEVLSGDDSDLLFTAWKRDNNSVSYANSRLASVSTKSLTDSYSIWKQRVRWASKLKNYEGLQHVSKVGGLIAATNLFAVLLLGMSLFNYSILFYTLLFFSTKAWLDNRFIISSFKETNLLMQFYVGLIYPIVFLSILIGSLFHNPKKASNLLKKW